MKPRWGIILWSWLLVLMMLWRHAREMGDVLEACTAGACAAYTAYNICDWQIIRKKKWWSD